MRYANHYAEQLRPLAVAAALALCCTIRVVAQADDAAAKRPLPVDYPELQGEDPRSFLTSNGSGLESTFTKLYCANADLLQRLSGYTEESIATAFGNRMNNEPDMHRKLLLAVFAAKSGNEEARGFIETLASSTDYAITLSRLSALRHLVHAPNPREWVFDAVHQSLSDTRRVTGLEKTNWQSYTQFEVSYLADEMEHLTYGLGAAKNPKSVEVLIEMAKRTSGSRGPVTALGMIGDPRAIPVCLELLHHEVEQVKKHPANFTAPSEELTHALGRLKANAAMPTLLDFLHSEHVIAALGEIGDERAIVPLRRVVAMNGQVDPDPYPWESRFQQRQFAARMALIKLERNDPIPQWIAILQDDSLEWSQRRQAVWELGWHPDPRAVAPLLKLVKSDPNGALVNQSITMLAAYHYKAAVAGLIECFDADFAQKSDWKRAYTPAMFSKNIAGTLHTLTGKGFGPDKARWNKWWIEEGLSFEGLK